MRPGSSSERSFFGRRCRDQRRGDHKERRRERLDRVPDQATLRGRQSGEGAERRAASRGRNTNSRARKKPYWWRPPAPVRQRAVPAGPQAAGGCDGQAHRTQEPVARDGSGAPGRKWPQALAKDMCAFRRSTANTSPTWRMCSTSMPRRPTAEGKWCASESPVQLIGEVRQWCDCSAFGVGICGIE
jgi:hypothetical protein